MKKNASLFSFEHHVHITIYLFIGESKAKHVLVLEVLGDKWRTIKYPLQSVRPFKFEHIPLSQRAEVTTHILIVCFSTFASLVLAVETSEQIGFV